MQVILYVVHYQFFFSLTTRDSYFPILVEVFMNHILVENRYFMKHLRWPEHNIMVLAGKKCKIIRYVMFLKKILSRISFMT